MLKYKVKLANLLIISDGIQKIKSACQGEFHIPLHNFNILISQSQTGETYHVANGLHVMLIEQRYDGMPWRYN